MIGDNREKKERVGLKGAVRIFSIKMIIENRNKGANTIDEIKETKEKGSK